MNYHDKSIQHVLAELKSDSNTGLSESVLKKNIEKYGYNVLSEKKKNSFISRILDALKEPMLIILLFGFFITFGVNLGKFLKNGEADFIESAGILFAVALSVSITIIMEGSSERAFLTLNRIYQNITVKAIRSGEVIVLDKKLLTVGDVVILENGDRIVADGRLLESNALSIDESALTGESRTVNKNFAEVLSENVPLAERRNMVYSGTFVVSGNGKMLITAVGDKTEMGKIAGEISNKKSEQSPLQQKLSKLGKTVTCLGAVCAVLILIISMLRLYFYGQITFSNVQDLFVSCIILIVAAVPEGLPTIVAVSLALNMIKLAKQNVLIKKMTATETAGAVSVICSDKTGTLTMNDMRVIKICTGEYCITPNKLQNEALLQNFICNNTAEIVGNGKKLVFKGSGTESALLKACKENDKRINYSEFRERYKAKHVVPFSSEQKIMITVIPIENGYRALLKGSPEKVLSLCKLSFSQKNKILSDMEDNQKKAQRILCFAHLDLAVYNGDDLTIKKEYVYDGYVALADPIRPEVKKSIADCQKASIKVKMLTGDNITTAFAIAKQLNIAQNESEIVNAVHLENLTDEELKKILPKITVIARSTPIIKLRVVRVLKEMGEVVAVTGDGINDAPAIKHADVGIAMGGSGSEITKETADVVLLNDSFATVVKTVSFGRNVYRNLQRFIVFQLSVNFSALLYITVCAILGLPSPFNTLQLLWINVIMDGPPALTLGINAVDDDLLNVKPVKRKDAILNKRMFMQIAFNGLFIGLVMTAQTLFNFLNSDIKEVSGTLFTLFVLFQLFNAFNSVEIGDKSVLKNLRKQKVMLYAFGGVFLLHIVIVQFFSALFSVNPISFTMWVKCIITAFSIVVVSEGIKCVIRAFRRKRRISIGETSNIRILAKNNNV